MGASWTPLHLTAAVIDIVFSLTSFFLLIHSEPAVE